MHKGKGLGNPHLPVLGEGECEKRIRHFQKPMWDPHIPYTWREKDPNTPPSQSPQTTVLYQTHTMSTLFHKKQAFERIRSTHLTSLDVALRSTADLARSVPSVSSVRRISPNALCTDSSVLPQAGSSHPASHTVCRHETHERGHERMGAFSIPTFWETASLCKEMYDIVEERRMPSPTCTGWRGYCGCPVALTP